MANNFDFQNQIVHVGDRIAVYQKIEEEGKSRTQIFEGMVIAVKGRNDGKSFLVRKISAGSIGVERIFPVHSPFLEKIVIKAAGNVRRSKLYYLRHRTGRQALRVKEDKSSAKN